MRTTPFTKPILKTITFRNLAMALFIVTLAETDICPKGCHMRFRGRTLKHCEREPTQNETKLLIFIALRMSTQLVNYKAPKYDDSTTHNSYTFGP